MRATVTNAARQQVAGSDVPSRMSLAVGVAGTAVVGYAIAVGLARATRFAERIEEDQYCHPTEPAARSALR
jgi:hypothetical protein